MKIGDRKQHVPIFVGSTFEDMKGYRRAVQDALTQLETVVRGMEYFGSKPGTPVDECLRVVGSCQVYIGMFGMRYGSIPEESAISMTHLEYDEAQRCELPSLIYILDEDAQPILPKHVETGPGAESLRRLKEQLRRAHLVSSFTTPENLSARILHDVPEVLTEIGTAVDGELPGVQTEDSAEILRYLKILPKMMRGRGILVQFETDAFHSVGPDICQALSLEAGATVGDYVSLSNEQRVYVYASGDTARRLVDLPEGSRVRANAVTVYGVTAQVEWGEDGPITTNVEHAGLRVEDVLDIAPPDTDETA